MNLFSKKKKMYKVAVWIISVCIILSGISISTGKSMAEEFILDLMPDTTVKSTTVDEAGGVSQMDIPIAAPAGYSTVGSLIDAGYTELIIGYKVTSYNAYSDGTPGVLPYIAHGSSWEYATSGWRNLSDAATGTATISLSSVAASEELKRFGLLICNVQGGLTYQITSAVLSGNGSGGGSGTGGTIPDGSDDIATDIEYNYAKLLQESLYFYDANMCGADVSEISEFSWRNDCHLGDRYVTYNGKNIDVSGGYHDAGDHAKFGLPQAYSASVLGMSYYEFKDAFTELGLTSHYKRIMNHFVEYFEKCTVLDKDISNSDAKVLAFCYQVGDGETDHAYWGAPEKQDGVQGTRASQALFTSAATPGTDIVCETSAALAIYAVNFNDTKALKYAEKLFEYADGFSNKSSTYVAKFYESTSWEDDYALAAAWLYKATGNSKYASCYNNSKLGSQNWVGWVLSWDDVASAAMLYSPNSSQRRYAADYVTKTIGEKTQTGDNNYVKIESWGTARYNTALQLTGLIYDSNKYGEWADGQMKYLLGNNAGNHCFVVGYNKYSSKYPHHRAASGYEGSVAGTRQQAHSLIGALVGGPSGTSVGYVDTADDYNQNEVALDYNAGFVGAAAGLYLYIKENGTTDAKNVQKTVSKSEISNELRNIIGETSTEETSTEETSTEETSTEETSTEETSTEEQPDIIKVQDIKLNKTSITLYVGQSDTITAEVIPSTAYDKSLVWDSSDRSVVSVSNGSITALKEGTAQITAIAKDGSGVYRICNVIVKQRVQIETKVNMSKTVVANLSDYIYTGKSICPTLNIKYNGVTLKQGIDYGVSYLNNKNIGTATVKITGKGKYTGTIQCSFKIKTKKGKTYTVGNYKYKITNASTNGKGTVKLTKVIKQKATATIPATIKLGGKTFKVTSINNKAFKNNNKLTKLVIGKNITSIGSNAFYGCKKLKSINIYSTKLKSSKVGRKSFAKIKATVKIKVPKKKKSAYKKLLYKKGVNKKTATIY